jgi:hypothetical protein
MFFSVKSWSSISQALTCGFKDLYKISAFIAFFSKINQCFKRLQTLHHGFATANTSDLNFS